MRTGRAKVLVTTAALYEKKVAPLRERLPVLVWLPAIGGVSLAAYTAIGCLLIGVIALQPRLAGSAFRPAAKRPDWLTGSKQK